MIYCLHVEREHKALTLNPDLSRTCGCCGPVHKLHPADTLTSPVAGLRYDYLYSTCYIAIERTRPTTHDPRI